MRLQTFVNGKSAQICDRDDDGACPGVAGGNAGALALATKHRLACRGRSYAPESF